ncbi:alpha-L-fucosidase [Scytonema hofmannii PCC 7110]|uniref:Alpha-L-fucosidase n=1 Tax=Scytonema hofmannii PCC 7110 TaxID=128403 RepID=A0A139XAZ9_9CYAN|nr:ComF family protein [Scytonema hofmannii]KYC41878.1 alpha-L-fucosidase [Scytonema hofmannii PCC 7110]
MQFWGRNFQSLLQIFLKSNCPLCQRSTSQEVCQNCTQQLQRSCLPNPGVFWNQPLPVFAWGSYGGTLKLAIAAMKYKNHPEIARPLGQYLGNTWLSSSPAWDTKCIVVPIPLHPKKQKKRGFNQAALIAQSFCETTGLQLKVNGLERVEETEAQYGLSVSERKKNLAKALRVGQDFRRTSKAPVLLIDDIYTTGATAKSATQTFHQAGIGVLGMVATAITFNQNNPSYNAR